MDLVQMEQRAEAASNLLKAMSNETRLMILCQLVHGERTVSQLDITADLSQSALSQHLAVLRQNGLVTTRRESQSIYYALAGEAPQAVIETLYGIFNKEGEDSCCLAAD